MRRRFKPMFNNSISFTFSNRFFSLVTCPPREVNAISMKCVRRRVSVPTDEHVRRRSSCPILRPDINTMQVQVLNCRMTSNLSLFMMNRRCTRCWTHTQEICPFQRNSNSFNRPWQVNCRRVFPFYRWKYLRCSPTAAETIDTSITILGFCVQYSDGDTTLNQTCSSCSDNNGSTAHSLLFTCPIDYFPVDDWQWYSMERRDAGENAINGFTSSVALSLV